MNGLFRRGSLRGAEPAEATVLETDVVRFMAIVGLTLMVIFALVQSLPYEGDAATSQVELKPQRDPERELAEARSAQAALTRELAESEQRERRAAGELDSTRRELERARVRLAALETQSEVGDADHREQKASLQSEIEQLQAQLQRSEAEQQRRTRAAEERAETLEAELRRVEPKPVAQPEPQPVATAEPEKSPRVVDRASPETLVLRFRDDRVYLGLLSQRKIRSYLHLSELDLTYEVLQPVDAELRFSLVYGIDDGALYEIPDGTVPPVLSQATRDFDLRLSLRDDLDYIVVLSDRIRSQVTGLEAQGRVGYYDILADERVVPAETP